jgi:hypothetical protein
MIRPSWLRSMIQTIPEETEMKCERCGHDCDRDSVHNGVCMLYGPWGCPNCKWREGDPVELHRKPYAFVISKRPDGHLDLRQYYCNEFRSIQLIRNLGPLPNLETARRFIPPDYESHTGDCYWNNDETFVEVWGDWSI